MTSPRAARIARAIATAEWLEPRRLLATFVVDTVDDVANPSDGRTSLREAITAANSLAGVDRIEFNIGGGGPQTIRPTTMLPAILSGVVIDGRSQPGYAGKPIIQISGELAPANADGLRVGSLASTISGLVISRFGAQGFQITALANRNVLIGNYIGTELDGVTPAPNTRGILLSGFQNVIGGTTAEDRNVISGNAGPGIQINGTAAADNVVRGNYIGTDATGAAALGNATTGVHIGAGADRNIIGTNGDGNADDAEGNVISANRDIGVRITGSGTTQNVVAGNLIGTDAAGTAALGNVNWGVYLVDRTTSNRIGTNNNGVSDALERNVIAATRVNAAGQFGDGIKIQTPGTNNNAVAGNFIGTDVTGAAALGNARRGVFIEGGSFNSIGRSITSAPDLLAGNLISGNAAGGILVSDPESFLNEVSANRIGTDLTGTAVQGNGGPGVELSDGSLFTNVYYNAIMHNAAQGVSVTPGAGGRAPRATIRLNAIDANGGLGIDLGGDGVTPNDLFDADQGPNDLQNAPLIDAVQAVGPDETEVTGRLFSAPFDSCTIDFYASPDPGPAGALTGARYLGTTFTSADETGHAQFTAWLSATLAPGEIVTATAGSSAGTSEFAGRVTADPGGSYFAEEGQGSGGIVDVQLNGVALDLGGDGVTLAWDLDNDGVFDDSTALDPTLSIPDEGPAEHLVALRVTNSAGQTSIGTTVVRLANASPETFNVIITGSENNPLAAGAAAVVSGEFLDRGLLDTHTLTVVWGDGIVETLPATRAPGAASGSFTFSHTYAAGGIYNVGVTVVDDDGGESGFGFATVFATGAGVQFGVLNVVGTVKADALDLTGNSDGSVTVAASFLARPVTFAAGEIFGVNAFLSDKNDRATARGSIVGLSMFGGSGSDVLTAGEVHTFLYGDAGNDTLTGGASGDHLVGGEGNDLLDAGVAADPNNFDLLFGEAGNDSLVGRNGFVFADGATGNDTFLTNAETGSTFYGQEGNDRATGAGGSDNFFGGPGRDLLDGRGGGDALYGEVGGDSIFGGDGNDALLGGTESDLLDGGGGNDIYYFDIAFNDAGGAEADAIVEADGPGGNVVTFESVYDPADGVIADLTRSGAGAIVHRNGSRTVSLAGGSSFAALYGGSGDDVLTGNAANNFISGNWGNDVIRGSGGSDELRGGDGNDQLFGDAGNDFLAGEFGADTIDGGDGADTLLDPGDAEDILNSLELP